MKKFLLLFLVLICAFLLFSCRKPVNTGDSTETSVETSTATLAQDADGSLVEREVQEIPLIGSIAEPKAEVSGMAWCGTHLILLPQYPDRFNIDGTDHIFSIEERELDAYLKGEYPDGIEPEWIPFESGDLKKSIDGFEGFESIVFNGDDFYVSIEARQSGALINLGWMMSYFVKGQVEGDCSSLILDTSSMKSFETPTDISNLSYETMLIFQDRLYAIYEANGSDVNPNPVAHVFDLDLGFHSEIEMPNIEYRITDATQPGEDGFFWVMNYFFPGDTELEASVDPIEEEFGLGESHQFSETVERLLRLKINETSIQLVDEAPIYIQLLEDDSRNWEGIVGYGDGFLLVTDKFPTTILAYIEADRE